MKLILLIIILILCYIIYNLYQKFLNLKNIILNVDSETEIGIIYNELKDTIAIMEQIDSKGLFKNDDHTGIVFSNLNKTLQNLNSRLNTLRN